ncbi:hypothetical protein CRE_27182 [Caenorhabditis remanei]|uniref:Uncharacterized protein n=1 Tax=Caenorhabditis remanei TaxID=31234 RepID=E3LNX2_CAERE|nr:hypothetical protein CRE_27182 [Caenorhabditis remanei]
MDSCGKHGSELDEVICEIKKSFTVLKRVPDLMEKEKKDYLYTDDPEYKSLFDDCQKEHPEIVSNFDKLKLEVQKIVDENQKVNKAILELEQLFSGFYVMIGELEVEHSVLEYRREIDKSFMKLFEINQDNSECPLGILHNSRVQILIAGEVDRSQENFINAVFNTKRAGEEVSEADRTDHVNNQINTLIYSTGSVMNPVDYPIDQMTECHEVAKKINAAATKLRNSLSKFEASLNENPIGDAPNLFKKVKLNQKSLYSIVSSFPALYKKNHKMEAIEKSVQNMANC